MGEGSTGSTVPRRQLGRYLRDLRNQAGLTVRAASRELEWSEAKLWRIETGQTSLRSLDVQAMCDIYGAGSDMKEALRGLAKETKAKGWWHAYGDVIPERFDVFIGLEEAAAQIDWYEAELVPGLLQTEDYARTLIEADNPSDDKEDVERRVSLRLARQALLRRPTSSPRLRLVLNEGVLRRPIGSYTLMAGQLARMVQVSELPGVSIRVVPFEAGLHQGVMSGQFGVLRFPTSGDGRETEPPTVYAEGFTGALYLDKQHEVDRYDRAFLSIWEKSLDEQASQHLLSEMAGSYDKQE